jgi:hypothetical protein
LGSRSFIAESVKTLEPNNSSIFFVSGIVASILGLYVPAILGLSPRYSNRQGSVPALPNTSRVSAGDILSPRPAFSVLKKARPALFLRRTGFTAQAVYSVIRILSSSGKKRQASK